jgi:hypothetical protein
MLTDHGLVASKHDAVQSERAEDGATNAAEQVACLTSPAVPPVAVETARNVMQQRDDEDCVGVWRNAVLGSCPEPDPCISAQYSE